VDAGRQSVNEARSKLLPSVDLSGTYLIIDKDMAEAGMGQQAERTLSGSATATQVIFSEPAWANLSIQKSIQKTREFDYQQLKLDIAQQAVTGYLNVLRAKSYERIQQENLRLTRHNLELARVREAVGSASPAEVYRWESEIALNRKAVIEANSQRNQAEIQVNRLLHRPAEESFLTQEADMHDPALITSHDEIFQYIENRQVFRIFRQFMVEQGFQNAPELAALDAAVAAQERYLTSANNNFWAPTVALQAGVNNKFSREGAGTEGISLPPEFSSLFSFPEPKDLSWNVALNVSFPLLQGGSKFILRQKAIKELTQLRTEREAAAELIEQRIRSALHVAGASHAIITQTRLAAEAARKSLDVVQDAYSQGLVSIVELLDTQNIVMQTDQLKANAVYDFLIDLMEVERAIGTSDFFATEEDHDNFINSARQYIEKGGIILK
jgi:outer membrane protein TolC